MFDYSVVLSDNVHKAAAAAAMRWLTTVDAHDNGAHRTAAPLRTVERERGRGRGQTIKPSRRCVVGAIDARSTARSMPSQPS